MSDISHAAITPPQYFLHELFTQLHTPVGRLDHQQATRFQQTRTLRNRQNRIVHVFQDVEHCNRVKAGLRKRRIGNQPNFHIFDSKFFPAERGKLWIDFHSAHRPSGIAGVREKRATPTTYIEHLP
jgi:hypothetical protein